MRHGEEEQQLTGCDVPLCPLLEQGVQLQQLVVSRPGLQLLHVVRRLQELFLWMQRNRIVESK